MSNYSLIKVVGRANSNRPSVHVGNNFLYLNRSFIERMELREGDLVSFYEDRDDPHVILMVFNQTGTLGYKIRQGRVGTPTIAKMFRGILGEYPRIEFTENEGEVLLHGQTE